VSSAGPAASGLVGHAPAVAVAPISLRLRTTGTRVRVVAAVPGAVAQGVDLALVDRVAVDVDAGVDAVRDHAAAGAVAFEELDAHGAGDETGVRGWGKSGMGLRDVRYWRQGVG
jgi:hypothetical protein